MGSRRSAWQPGNTLRLEVRYPLYGNDIDQTTNPWEAGLGWIVKLDSADFVGKEALLKLKQTGCFPQAGGIRTPGPRNRPRSLPRLAEFEAGRRSGERQLCAFSRERVSDSPICLQSTPNQAS